MKYLRTKLATDCPEKGPFQVKLLECLLFFIPKANPGYDDKLHLVKEWFIEFNDDGDPWREIGIGVDGNPILAGPDGRNYGFWLDTKMSLKNFTGESLEKSEFERLWKLSGVTELKLET